MALLADAICLSEPRCDFIVDLIDLLESKRMQMISRRESFDAAKARILQAPRQNNVAVHPVLPNDECCETHPNLESDPRFLWQNRDRSVLLRNFQELVEDGADIFRLTGKVRRECMSPAAVRLISIGELPSAIRTPPHRWLAIRSSDRSSDNGRGRCDNSHRSRARAAGNFADTCRT
jgi:hypothetical protein